MITVRFGNVLGSDGSVLRIFEKQLREGHPLTITDPQATRYFMSCEEAALLVLEAGGQSCTGCTFLLDMGEPVAIQELASELVRLWGGDPDDPSNYEYIGLLPGEKLHEKLENPWEGLERATSYLLRVKGPVYEPGADVESVLGQLRAVASDNDEDDLRRALFEQLGSMRPRLPAEQPAPSERSSR
jgi:O-antigen biosynthesis protein WbqV